jgi:UDP-N-acetylmuramate--alanine ligase
MTLEKKSIATKDRILEIIKEKDPALVLTVGAGDIDTLVEPIKNALSYA